MTPSLDAPITTDRLSLVLLLPDALHALGDRDHERASRLQGLHLPPDFVAQDGSDDFFLRVQEQRQREYPGERGWCARVIVRAEGGVVLGHCGFHGPPRAIGRAEIGYSVLPSHRGQGVASEAVAALVRWAWDHGEQMVFASVAPQNAASLAVVRKVGFIQIGSQMDEIDGEELVFEIRATATRTSGQAERPV